MTILPPYCPESVRVAGPEDAASLFWLLVSDLQADNDIGYPVSEKKVAKVVHDCCYGTAGIAGVIDGPGGIIGSIGIIASQPYYSERWYLAQIWNFVIPEHRKGTHHGEDLMAFAKWHRADMSARVGEEMDLENTVMSGNRLPAKLRFWRRHGVQIGGIFMTGGDHG